MGKEKLLSSCLAILVLTALLLPISNIGVPPIRRNAVLADTAAPGAVFAAGSNATVPGDFASEAELLLWLENNSISELPAATTNAEWFNKARMVQADGMKDGFVINVDYDYNMSMDAYGIYNTVVIEGSLYYWDPETDNVTMEENLTGVE